MQYMKIKYLSSSTPWNSEGNGIHVLYSKTIEIVHLPMPFC